MIYAVLFNCGGFFIALRGEGTTNEKIVHFYQYFRVLLWFIAFLCVFYVSPRIPVPIYVSDANKCSKTALLKV
jgi:hypothetical protein